MVPLHRAARELGRTLAAVWRDPETKALPVVAGALVLTGAHAADQVVAASLASAASSASSVSS
jgi:hypothetical protein